MEVNDRRLAVEILVDTLTLDAHCWYKCFSKKEEDEPKWPRRKELVYRKYGVGTDERATNVYRITVAGYAGGR